MSEYKHGTMDVNNQEKTFAGFIKGCIWISGISIGILVFLAVFNS
ncbi:MAG TPA: aa3-type cytochrome c oxidase subunit IV [Rhodobacteraceae bacterium]|nr:aa3-type cytochrome c oxidase subunit IV [Paracoccaceae bacterium]